MRSARPLLPCLLALAVMPVTAQLPPSSGLFADPEAAAAGTGLFITPWREDPASDMDRPPGLYDERPEPLDPAAFQDLIRLRQQLEAYRARRLQGAR